MYKKDMIEIILNNRFYEKDRNSKKELEKMTKEELKDMLDMLEMVELEILMQ